MKLFQQLLVAPAALGLAAPMAVSAADLNLAGVSRPGSTRGLRLRCSCLTPCATTAVAPCCAEALSQCVLRYMGSCSAIGALPLLPDRFRPNPLSGDFFLSV